MGFLDNIGKFRVGGSIDTQFRTGNALERIAIASGQQAGGFTSFLATLEFLGFILLILTSLFIISAFAVIYTLLFIGRVWSFFFPSKEQRRAYAEAEARGEFMTDEELERLEKRFELSDEDMEEINNFH